MFEKHFTFIILKRTIDDGYIINITFFVILNKFDNGGRMFVCD